MARNYLFSDFLKLLAHLRMRSAISFDGRWEALRPLADVQRPVLISEIHRYAEELAADHKDVRACLSRLSDSFNSLGKDVRTRARVLAELFRVIDRNHTVALSLLKNN